MDEFSGQHPIHGLLPLLEANPEMTFLEKSEIEKLLSVLVGDDLLVALSCLSTGGRCHTETSTDNKLQGYLFENQKRQKRQPCRFLKNLRKKLKRRPALNCSKSIMRSFTGILRRVKPDIPPNQATHILRHTFASHFMMNGGKIIALQQILGHPSIPQTMAQAHLAPDYLQNAVALNPLNGGVIL